jgi:hypothetical protein
VLVDGTCRCPLSGVASCARCDYEHVVSGSKHSCVIRGDGSVLCWGLDTSFQIRTTPTDSGYEQLRAAAVATCALRGDGTPACWGFNQGRLIEVPPGPFESLVVGWDSACGKDAAGAYTCWGSDEDGTISLRPSGPLLDLALGWRQGCAILPSRSITCWGRNDRGQTNAPAGNDFVSLSLASWHGCAIRENATVTCWGSLPSWPTGTVKSLWSRGLDTCAIMSDDAVACWGQGAAAIAPTGLRARAVAVADGHACALDLDGNVRCWGTLPWSP